MIWTLVFFIVKRYYWDWTYLSRPSHREILKVKLPIYSQLSVFLYSLAGSNKENIESETAHIKSVYHVSCTHLQVPIKGQFWHWCTSSHRRWNYTVQYQMLHTRHSPCYFYRCLDNSESKIDMLELLQNCNICNILIKWKKDNNECHWYFINL